MTILYPQKELQGGGGRGNSTTPENLKKYIKALLEFPSLTSIEVLLVWIFPGTSQQSLRTKSNIMSVVFFHNLWQQRSAKRAKQLKLVFTCYLYFFKRVSLFPTK